MSAHFYFDLDDGTETLVDENGARATTSELAIQEALEVIAEIRAEDEIDLARGWDLVIRDVEGSVVKRISIR